jgi:esterase/lipase superfamily enzyme/nucleoid DNA-binding protein
MTENALISQIALRLDIPKATVRRLLAELIKIAAREFKKSGICTLPGLGEFLATSSYKGRVGRNPQTSGEVGTHAQSRRKVGKKAAKRIAGKGKGPAAFNVATTRDIKVGPLFRFKSKDLVSRFAGEAHYLSAHFEGGGNGGAAKPADSPSLRTSEEPAPSHSVVRIFYATDREPTSKDPLRYGSRRSVSGELSLGTCDVSIPRDHRMAKIERPSILRLEFSENPNKHFVIREITLRTSDEFYLDLSKRVELSEKKEAFVFVHGFRVPFDEAVYRTAQIAYDLGFSGAPILYSWPSNGKLYEYTGDLNNNEWTVDHLKGFLQELASKSGAKVIHLIAHSMGNRALLNALRLLVVSKPTPVPHFNQVILTAPDIDADLFMQIAKVIQGSADRITLYASKRDKALAASKKINASYPRAGDCSSSVVVLSGVDTIDASAVDTNLIGHFYYAENRSVLSDVFNLLRDGGPPPRFGIRPVDVTPPYWRFAP